MTWDNREPKRRHTIFLKGWDAALMGLPCQPPYSREDFLASWISGWRRCMANEALPAWALPTINPKGTN